MEGELCINYGLGQDCLFRFLPWVLVPHIGCGTVMGQWTQPSREQST